MGMISIWLVGEFTTLLRTYFSGDWDVDWGYDLDFDPWPDGRRWPRRLRVRPFRLPRKEAAECGGGCVLCALEREPKVWAEPGFVFKINRKHELYVCCFQTSCLTLEIQRWSCSWTVRFLPKVFCGRVQHKERRL